MCYSFSVVISLLGRKNVSNHLRGHLDLQYVSCLLKKRFATNRIYDVFALCEDLPASTQRNILKSSLFVFILLQIWFWSQTTSTETNAVSCYWRHSEYLSINLRVNVNVLPSLPFCSIQRKSLDLNLQPATAPSRGKTLPTPVQLEFTNSRNNRNLV